METSLQGSHHRTYQAIFQHPVSRNLAWRDVCSMLDSMEGMVQVEWEAVVEQFLPARAVLPMQLFTLFNSDERAIHHVDRQRREIHGVVKRIQGRLEWGLRLTFDEKSVREAVDAKARAMAAQAAPKTPR